MERQCTHRIAVQDFMCCDNTGAGKNTVICEFPDWKGKECPFDMLERGEITDEQFYELWKKAVILDAQNQKPKK